jgi:hypothetical protein
LQLDEGKLTGIKTWCSASSWVESGLLTYRDEQNRSQLLIVDMQQPVFSMIILSGKLWDAAYVHSATGI